MARTYVMYAIEQTKHLVLRNSSPPKEDKKGTYMSDGSGNIYRLRPEFAAMRMFEHISTANSIIAKTMKNLDANDIVSGSVSLEVVPITLSIP